MLAVRALARRPGWVTRTLALVLVLAGAGVGYDRAWDLALRRAKAARGERRPYKPVLVNWLHEQARAHGGRLVVAMTAQEPQKIAWHTRGVGYHWFYRGTGANTLRKMVEAFSIRYVLVGRKEAGWAVFRSEWFGRTFEPVTVGGRERLGGMRVYRRRARPEEVHD